MRPTRHRSRRPGERPTILMTHDYPPITGGGLALSVGELARLASDDCRVLVLSSRLADHFADDRGRLPCHRSAEHPQYAHARTGWGVVGAIGRADMLVTHWTFSFRPLSTLSVLIGPALGTPTVCVIHTTPEHCRHNRVGRLPVWVRKALIGLMGRALRRCDAVVALGNIHAAALSRAGLPITHVLPLMVSPSQGWSSGRDLEQATSISGERPVVGIAGEFSVLKGADRIPDLVRALAPAFHFRLAGTGPLRSSLLETVAALPTVQRSSVSFVGLLEPAQMPGFYREIDFLVVLSRAEAQSRVVLEAMLAGVIVVAAKDSGVDDLVSHAETGLLLDVREFGSWQAHLMGLVTRPRLMASIRRAARDHALGQFQVSDEGWRRLLGDLVATGS
jgi:glycosyltransferase involved in cell wall biosynthesis